MVVRRLRILSGPPHAGACGGPNERSDVRLPLKVAWRGHVHSHSMGRSHAVQPVQKREV